MNAVMDAYHRELERVRLRAMIAVERVTGGGNQAALERELGRVEAMRAGPGHARAAALAERLGLVDDEVDLLWTAVAVAADPRVQPHVRALGGGEVRHGLSLATYALIADLDGDHARMLARRLLASNPLFADGVLTWASAEHAPAARTIAAPARTIAWLGALDELDPALGGAGTLVRGGDLALDARQLDVLDRLERLLADPEAPLILVEGAPGSGRATALAEAAGGRATVALDLRRVPHAPAPLEAALLGLRRECRLRDAVPVLAAADELIGDDGAELVRVVARAIDAWRGPFAITAAGTAPELPVARPLARVRWPVPDVATRAALWARALGAEAAALPGPVRDAVAMRYRLGAGGIRRAVATARLYAGAEAPTPAHLVEGVRASIAERLGELATRHEVAQAWDDVVLAPDLLDQIAALIARVRHAHTVLEGWGFGTKVARGGGVAALFSGPPGTGKTMVAGLIARELDLELYQVDLSKVVSKWVGETEKQLARVFEAAEAGHALLLFDEADALFAKRTEVKGANDRYANLEVNYLLQRIESFGGITILTTNLDASIDPALKRRLASHVVFWPPDVDERARLWRGFITPRAPVEGTLDADALADQFPEMTGANIRNAVVAAAFLAAGEGRALTQTHLERAGRGEYAAMGRVISARRT